MAMLQQFHSRDDVVKSIQHRFTSILILLARTFMLGLTCIHLLSVVEATKATGRSPLLPKGKRPLERYGHVKS